MTRLTIAAAFRLLAERDPDALAVRDDAEAISRAELILRSERVASVLAQSGVQHGDLVTVLTRNDVDTVAAFVAIWMLGATPQPLSPRLPADEQRAIVELAQSWVVVGGDTLPLGPYPDEPRYVGPDLAASSWKAPTSSGSTGRPKIVLATASAHIDPDSRVADFIPKTAVQLVCAPLSHSAPFTYAMRGLMTGHSLVLIPRFDAERVLDAISTHRVTWAMLVPTMMHRMLRLPADIRESADLSSLESILHIGARCADETKRGFIDWIGAERVVEVYAGSESAGLTMIRGDEWLEHPGSVGRGIGGTTLRITDAGGRELPAGETGLVQMRRDGPARYSYLGAEAPDLDGWHTLGDTGRLDADSYLYIVDRADDLIVTGGVKVYPIEIEQVLERHPLVRSAVAVGVPDEDLGAAIHAVIDIADAGLTEPELREWLALNLDPEKRPRTIQLVREPLRDDAGKVRRSAWAP